MTVTPSKAGWLDLSLLWLPLGAAGVAGVFAYTHGADQGFVQNAPNQYGQWILAVFSTGLAGTLVGLACLIPEIWSGKSSRAGAVLVSLFLAASFVCGGILLVHTEGAKAPGVPDPSEDIMLVGFAAASLAAVGLKVWQERDSFWIARLLAVELPATITITIIVVAKYHIYTASNPHFPAWLSAQQLYLGNELAQKAQINATATTALRDSFWVGVGFGVVGVQLLTSTIAATAIDIWRLTSHDKLRELGARG